MFIFFHFCFILLTDFVKTFPIHFFPFLFKGGQEQPQQQPEDQNQDGNSQGQQNQDGGNQQEEGEGGENQQTNSDPNGAEVYYPDENDISANGTETAAPAKKGMSWIPILIIVGAIIGLLVIGLIIMLLKRKGNKRGGTYGQAPTNESGPQQH
jgi:hypothetical protein